MEVKISDLLPYADISGLPAPVQADPDRVREAVMGKLKEEHMQTTKRPRKIRRTLVIAVAAAALLGVTALAAAMAASTGCARPSTRRCSTPWRSRGRA